MIMIMTLPAGLTLFLILLVHDYGWALKPITNTLPFVALQM